MQNHPRTPDLLHRLHLLRVEPQRVHADLDEAPDERVEPRADAQQPQPQRAPDPGLVHDLLALGRRPLGNQPKAPRHGDGPLDRDADARAALLDR